MCDRCATMECAFGTRDPLPPRIASLDVEPTNAPETGRTNPGDENDSDVKALGSCGATDSIPQPFASTKCGTCRSTVVIQLTPQSSKAKATNAEASSHSVNQATNAEPSSHSVEQEDILPSLGAPFSKVPVSGPNTRVKWSDVVTFGSEALQARATTTRSLKTKVAKPFSILHSIIKHEDILDLLMLNCPDFPTLFALVVSCKATKQAFERHSQGIIRATLDKMPQELRHLTVALIGINGSRIEDSRSIKTLMKTWLGLGPKPLTARLRNKPLEIIRKLASTFRAIDLFVEVITKNCVNNLSDFKKVLASRMGLDHDALNLWGSKHPLLQQTEFSHVADDTELEVPSLPSSEVGPQEISLPLNDRETYRIKRGCLLLENFCALFYLGPDRHFDTRHHPHRFNHCPRSSRRRAFRNEQAIFFKNYVNPWEVGEVAVITQFMYDLVRKAFFHKYKCLRYDEAYNSWFGRWGRRQHGQNRHHDHEEVVDEFDNHVVWHASQGLSLLAKIYHDRNLAYSALTEKYGAPRYRLAEFFLPIEECSGRRGYGFASDPAASWTPRTKWSDTPGLELPSRGWLAKSPATDDTLDNTAYWGEKWMRKIGYFIWDRDASDNHHTHTGQPESSTGQASDEM